MRPMDQAMSKADLSSAQSNAAPRLVPVELAADRYDVVIGSNLASELVARLTAIGLEAPRRVMVAIDAGLHEHEVDRWIAALEAAGYAVHRHVLTASEHAKSLASLEGLLIAMARAKLERRDALLALGGGVIGDLAGFAAATYQRGLRWVQAPTTLLSMVDASVGGKTGINLAMSSDGHDVRKNYIGAFHQPALVVADVCWLASLPIRQRRAGLAECLKHGLLSGGWGDAELWDWTESALPRLFAPDRQIASDLSAELMTELVARNVAIKAKVVATDPHERVPLGGRVLLNLGHTFAHAIEPMANLSPDGDPSHAPLHHGEAVALGLIAAATTGARAGRSPSDLPARVRRAVAAAGLPTAVAGLPANDDLIQRMRADKKVMSGRMRLIIPTAKACSVVADDIDPRAIAAGWDAIRV
jgi:3-dehydroquinate synthetase